MKQQDIPAIINQLDRIGEGERKTLLNAFKKLEKKATRKSFMLMRLQKDKDIATNILNETIKDLERHKREIEEQKAIIEEKSKTLEDNLQKLELSYNELEKFSYIASHDLKSPLRTISSFAQLLKRRYYNQLNDDANDFIEYIVSGVQQMNDVIRSSLEYARVGKDESIHEATDLNIVLGLVQLNLKDDIDKNKADIRVPELLPTVIGNKTSLLQVFQNLIDNSLKFRSQTKPVIEISYQKVDTDFWEFHVKDNGIGIASDYQKEIFLPFKRLNEVKEPGEGIGLAICKKIIENHGGTIHFESIDEGTTFIFTFPVLKEG